MAARFCASGLTTWRSCALRGTGLWSPPRTPTAARLACLSGAAGRLWPRPPLHTQRPLVVPTLVLQVGRMRRDRRARAGWPPLQTEVPCTPLRGQRQLEPLGTGSGNRRLHADRLTRRRRLDAWSPPRQRCCRTSPSCWRRAPRRSSSHSRSSPTLRAPWQRQRHLWQRPEGRRRLSGGSSRQRGCWARAKNDPWHNSRGGEALCIAHG